MEPHTNEAEVTPENSPPNTDTPPAPTPEVKDTTKEDNSARLLELYTEQMRANNTRIQQLEQEATALRTRAETSPPADPAVERERFYNDPRSVIQEEVRKAIEPLAKFVSGVQANSQYDTIKAKFKNDPRFSKVFPKIEATLDSQVRESGTAITEQQYYGLLLATIGGAAAGLIPGVSLTDDLPSNSTNGSPNNPAPTNGNNSMSNPPNVRPTSPPAPAPRANANNATPLTELERRIMREQGFSNEADYRRWMNMPATEVATASFDKPAPATGNR